MSAALRPCLLSPELLAFRDFRRDPPGVWLWPGGLEPFARVSAETYRRLAASDIAAGVSAAQLEILRRHGVLVDADALDEHTERVATALGLLADRCLPEAAAELRHARMAVPALTTTWLAEAFTLMRTGATRPSRRLLEQYLARWPGDPAAAALLAAMDESPWMADQRGRVMALAPSAAVARELVTRAADAGERIWALCASPPHPTVLLLVRDGDEVSGRCLRGGSPFARLIELTPGGVEDPTLLAHEVVHATLSSGNLAFAEGLALYVSAVLATPSSDPLSGVLAGLADEGEAVRELDRLFLDVDAQPGAFDRTYPGRASAPGTMSRAHWLAFLGTTALVARVGLVALVEYLRWLRDPTPAAALATQEQLFELHFGSSLRSVLRSLGSSGL
jgi:hypothetical protein